MQVSRVKKYLRNDGGESEVYKPKALSIWSAVTGNELAVLAQNESCLATPHCAGQ